MFFDSSVLSSFKIDFLYALVNWKKFDTLVNICRANEALAIFQLRWLMSRTASLYRSNYDNFSWLHLVLFLFFSFFFLVKDLIRKKEVSDLCPEKRFNPIFDVGHDTRLPRSV